MTLLLAGFYVGAVDHLANPEGSTAPAVYAEVAANLWQALGSPEREITFNTEGSFDIGVSLFVVSLGIYFLLNGAFGFTALIGGAVKEAETAQANL